MKLMDDLQQRAQDLEKAETINKDRKRLDENKTWHPESGCMPMGRLRIILGLYVLSFWALYILLSFVNNAGFWEVYVTAPYIILSLPVLFFTNGWIRMLFIPAGDLKDQDYQKTVLQCLNNSFILTVGWALIAVAEIFVLILKRSVNLRLEFIFLGGCLAAAVLSLAAYRLLRRQRYHLIQPDSPSPEELT